MKAQLDDKHLFDYVIHLAAHVPTPENAHDLDRCQEVNFDGTYNLLRYFGEVGLATFMYISSISVFNGISSGKITEETIPQPSSDYGISKLAGEYLGRLFEREHALAVPIIRLGTVYGRGMNEDRMISYFIEKCLHNEDFCVYDCSEYLYTIYIDDVLRIIEKTLSVKGGTYHLVNDSLTKKEIVQIIINKTDSRSRVQFEGKEKAEGKEFIVEKTKAKAKVNSFSSFENGIEGLIRYKKGDKC